MKINNKISRKSAILVGWFLVIGPLFSYGVLFWGGAKGIMFIALFLVTTFLLISGVSFIRGNY